MITFVTPTFACFCLMLVMYGLAWGLDLFSVLVAYANLQVCSPREPLPSAWASPACYSAGLSSSSMKKRRGPYPDGLGPSPCRGEFSQKSPDSAKFRNFGAKKKASQNPLPKRKKHRAPFPKIPRFRQNFGISVPPKKSIAKPQKASKKASRPKTQKMAFHPIHSSKTAKSIAKKSIEKASRLIFWIS